MRIAAVALVLASLPVASPRALASVAVVDERPGRLTLEVRFDETDEHATSARTLDESGLPRVRYQRFFIAAPRTARITGHVEDTVSENRRGPLPRVGTPGSPGAQRTDAATGAPSGFLPQEPFRVSGPLAFRGATVFAVDCFASQVDYVAGVQRLWSRYRIRFDYAPATASASEQRVDPLVRELVINRRTVPAPERELVAGSSVAPDPHFSLSPNWVKMSVPRPGAYVIDGNDLAQVGVDLASIDDPGSFRLFTGGGEQQHVDLRLADGTYLPGNWMTECDILVEYGGDGSFDPTDRIVFYGLGAPGWADLYRPGAPRLEYTDHLYANQNAYFLTWDDVPGFPGAPHRMSPVVASPSAGADVTIFEERLYFELDRAREFSFGGDGWLWFEVVKGTGARSFQLPRFVVSDLDASSPQTFRTVALAKTDVDNGGHHARYLMNGVFFAEHIWNGVPPLRYEDGQPVVATGYFLSEGDNTLTLDVPRDLNPEDFMYFAWYAVFYPRRLRADANDALFFSSPDTSSAVNFSVGGFGSATGPIYLFDVTDPSHPQQLTGFSETLAGGERSIRFSSAIAGGHRYYWAGTSSALMTGNSNPAGMVRHFPRDLRNVTSSPNMVIVTHPTFTSAAQALKQHRETLLPFYSSPRVEVVTSTDVFDNFSGGLPDAMAIRNYCKFLYDNYAEPGGSPSLAYVVLLGDANSDFKNIASAQPNFVTTSLNLNQFELDAYVTDDYFAYLDSTDTPGAGLLDVAIGRLPAASIQDAAFLVDRVISYELGADFGSWRDRVILLADDEFSKFNDTQGEFVFFSEGLAHSFLAPFLEPHKIYLTEFPFVGTSKPAARATFVDDWNLGALVINYVGHGSSVKLADEGAFHESDVGNLRNGLRMPLFVAMSCTVGDFAESVKSLSERLLLKDGGGAVGTVTASELTFISQNNVLEIALAASLFPFFPATPSPMGVALMNAKNAALSPVMPSRSYQENNEKYNLLGDPALRLHSPRRSIVFVPSDVDTLVAGKRETVRGTVYNSGAPDSTFFGTVRMTVREPDDASGYRRESDGFFIPYRYAGGTMYDGTADVVAGEFEFSFRVPRFIRFGDLAFVLAYAENGLIDAVDKNDRMVVRAPEPADSSELRPTDGPPRVEIGFENGGLAVKAGAVLLATARDGDGINVLNSTPEGRIAIMFDKAGLAVDATRFFEFDHGGVDTSGTLRFPLPDLSEGPHAAIFKVADAFGQVTVDTLSFTIVDALDYSAQVVFNYPNPFQTSTYFLVSLTDRAAVQLDIFTVSGRKIRSIQARKEGGEQWILWDGRDETGSSIANGTYLYVARVSFDGLDRPPLVLRGKLVKVE